MNLNLYYRAFKEYRKHTLKNKACVKQRQAIKQSAKGNDLIEIVRNKCIIDETWIQKIEEGLPFVEKAIAEERQFIINEGEVVEIEKIKRVSKESVNHLAKHSDLIKHLPKEGDEITPDKIFMVERLSDYAVYENRFLYMLLCYLRDFIDLRLKKIKEHANAYKSNTEIKRNIQTVDGKIVFEMTCNEERKNDLYSSFNKQTQKLVERIESCQHIVTSLLIKPLMVMVAKAPMIKPPITKTNVLRMNNKFKNAVALYEYISSYNGLGYTIEPIKKRFSPLSDNMEDEFAELINVTNFLSYVHGNELCEQLEEEYEAEELAKKEKEKAKVLERIKELKERVSSGKCSIEEYVVELEDANKLLIEENKSFKQTLKDYNNLKDKCEALKENVVELNIKLAEKDSELREQHAIIRQLNEKYETDMALLEEKRIKDLQDQAEEFGKKEQEIIASYQKELLDCKTSYEKELLDCKETYEKELSDSKASFEERLREMEDNIRTLKNTREELEKERDLLNAKMIALKKLQGEEIEGVYDDKQTFEQLEKEFFAFYEFFESKWADAKRSIRQNLLWNKIKSTKKKI